MDKSVTRLVRRDCHRAMWCCYVVYGFCALLGFLIPTLAAWLVGDMTDALLALNTAAIGERMLPFLFAILLEAVVYPLCNMLSDLLVVRRAGRYETFLMDRLLHRPLDALCGETGASVAEHVMVDTPDYYFIQFCKFTLPVVMAVYGGTLAAILLTGTLHPVFSLGILLLAGIPMVRAAVLGKLNARLSAEVRAYEIHRTGEEEIMFHARSFLRVNRLTEDCVEQFHSRFTTWYAACGSRKDSVTATKVVFDYLCGYGASLGVIFLGAILVLAGEMSVGALMTGYLLLPTISSFYRTIASRLEEIRREKDSQERLSVFYGRHIGDLETMEGEAPEACPAAKRICLSNATFAYPGGEGAVLMNCSEEFSAAETVRILGENGSGKTTMVRLLAGLYAPQSGAVTDEKRKRLTKETLRRMVTIQEQDGYIFQGTVWENLFIPEAQREEAKQLLDSLDFAKPLKYAVGAGAAELSPGERQKILAARALLRKSPFLIMDEPLNHLDAAGAENLLRHLNGRKGLILISHQELSLSAARTIRLH